MNFLEDFPTLAVEMTFSHLSKAELLEATFITPEANKIIGNSNKLMLNYRFKILRYEPFTRQYSSIDFFYLDRQSSFENLSVSLTEVTFDNCRLDFEVFHELLSKISVTLELLIVSRFAFYESDHKSNETESTSLQTIHFSKHKTLIIADLKNRP